MISRCLRTLRAGPLVLLVAASVAAAISGATYAAFFSTTANSGNSFAAASSFPACNTITPTWMTGFEHGFVSASGGGQFNTLVTTGGTPLADQAAVRNGAYSLRIAKTSAGASYTRRDVSGSTVVARVGLHLASLPSANVDLAFVQGDANLILGYDNATQKLRLSVENSSQLSANTVQAATWYLVEFRLTIGGLNSTAVWSINETAQTQVSAGTLLASSANAIGFGSTVAGHVFTANYDDILISTTSGHYPFGDGRIVRLAPEATAYPVANFQDHDGSDLDENSWQNIDDLPMTSTSDYIKQAASSSSYVQVSFADTQTCIKAVSATLAYSHTTAGTNDGKTSIFDGATERIVFDGNMNATALNYKSAMIAPASSPWTQSAINGLVGRIGYSTDVSPEPQWHALGLEFETYS